MLMGMYPTLLDEQGRLKGIMSRQFLASDSLEELKIHAKEEAQEHNERQFIMQWGGCYMLVEQYWLSSLYFQGKPIIARFAKSGKETTPRTEKGA
jgi:hypothetical protein